MCTVQFVQVGKRRERAEWPHICMYVERNDEKHTQTHAYAFLVNFVNKNTMIEMERRKAREKKNIIKHSPVKIVESRRKINCGK